MAGKRANQEGTIYQRENGKWRVQITLEDGKRVSRSFKTRKEAHTWMVESLKTTQEGLPLPAQKITVGQFLDRWLTDIVLHSLRPKTLESYESIIRVHLKPSIGSFRLSQLRPDHIQHMYSQKLAGGLSNRSVQYVHAVLHRALNQAVKWGLVTRNVTDMVQAPRPAKKPVQALTPAQVQTLLAALVNSRFFPLYLLAIVTGMREGEILGLRWDDVDLEGRKIHVTNTVQRLWKMGLVASTPKSDKGRRAITIPPLVVEVLKKHSIAQEEMRVFMGSKWRENGLVFTTSIGTPIGPRNILRHFHETLAKAGLPKVRFHDLRHTAATLLLSRGIHPKVVQEMLGHSTITLTLDTYSHVLPDMQEEAANQMEALVSGATLVQPPTQPIHLLNISH